MESTTRASVSIGKTLFHDEGGGQEQGTRAAHGEIIDGAVDGQLADIAAGEEERRDHERIRREGQARAAGGEDGLIVELAQVRVIEGGQKQLVDQLRGQLAAAAMAHDDVLAIGDGRRARQDEVFFHFHFRSGRVNDAAFTRWRP